MHHSSRSLKLYQTSLLDITGQHYRTFIGQYRKTLGRTGGCLRDGRRLSHAIHLERLEGINLVTDARQRSGKSRDPVGPDIFVIALHLAPVRGLIVYQIPKSIVGVTVKNNPHRRFSWGVRQIWRKPASPNDS